MSRIGALAVVLCVLAVAGCGYTIRLKHAQTGVVARCGPYYLPPSDGAAIAVERASQRCISDFQRQGYERLSD